MAPVSDVMVTVPPVDVALTDELMVVLALIAAARPVAASVALVVAVVKVTLVPLMVAWITSVAWMVPPRLMVLVWVPSSWRKIRCLFESTNRPDSLLVSFDRVKSARWASLLVG